MDLYLYTAIINTVWYIFTIVFVLYRFTSFFTYTYKFLLFSKRFWDGAVWSKNKIVNYVNQRRGYTRIYDEEDPEVELLYDNNTSDPQQPRPFFEALRNTFNKKESSVIELKQVSRGQQSSPASQNELDFDAYQSYLPSRPSFSQLHHDNRPSRNDSYFEDLSVFGTAGRTPTLTPKPFNVKSSSILMNSEFINQHLGRDH